MASTPQFDQRNSHQKDQESEPQNNIQSYYEPFVNDSCITDSMDKAAKNNVTPSSQTNNTIKSADNIESKDTMNTIDEEELEEDDVMTRN